MGLGSSVSGEYHHYFDRRAEFAKEPAIDHSDADEPKTKLSLMVLSRPKPHEADRYLCGDTEEDSAKSLPKRYRREEDAELSQPEPTEVSGLDNILLQGYSSIGQRAVKTS
jgi:hypothetical protein